MLSRHDATGPRAGKAAEGGGPESEDLPLSAHTEPLAEGRKGDGAMSRRLALAAALVVVALVPAAGGTAASGATTAAPFPVTVTAATARSRSRSARARIVSLSPTATETLFAIGAGSQVVAVDDQSDYPKSAPKTTLSGYTPNVEAIAGVPARSRRRRVRPEGPRRGARRGSGSRCSSTTPASTIPGAYEQIRQLGMVDRASAQAAERRRADEGADRGDRRQAEAGGRRG